MRRRVAYRVSMEAPHPATPSWRTRHADMSPRGFIGLVAGWSGAVVLILVSSAFIRFVG
jgi:hypothetical protein